MTKKIIIQSGIILALTVILIIISSQLKCDYFQRKMYTDDSDIRGRYFELCLKGQKAEKAGGGGNVMLCQPLMDDLTTAGKLKNLESCIKTYTTYREKLKTMKIDLNCHDLVYGKKK